MDLLSWLILIWCAIVFVNKLLLICSRNFIYKYFEAVNYPKGQLIIFVWMLTPVINVVLLIAIITFIIIEKNDSIESPYKD